MSDRLQNVLSRLHGVKQTGDGQYQARCPCHDDDKASLCIGENDGVVLLNDQAGCNTADIVAKIGLTFRDLFPPSSNGHATNGHVNGKTKSGKPKGTIAKTYDYRDEGGTLLYQKVRMEPKDFRQRAPKPGGGWNWSIKNVRKVLYNLDKITANPDATVWFFEGEKDCDNAAERGLLAVTNPDGASRGNKPKFDKKLAEQLRGRYVIICCDNDEAGRKHARHVAKLLKGIAASVRIVELPGLADKQDVSDWFTAGHTVDELQALADAAPEFVPEETDANKPKGEIVTPSGDKPVIVVNHEIKRMVDEGIAALRGVPGIYQRSGALSWVVDGGANPPGIERPSDAPRIVDIGRETLDELLPMAAEWVKKGADDEYVRANVPDKVTKALAVRGHWPGIPKIIAVVETPVVRADGSILQDFGYDQSTGIVFWRQGKFPQVPDRLTIGDARAAVAKLLAVVQDFPFASPAHRSAWLASVLTPFGRYAYHGASPLNLTDANCRGTGKTLLQAVTTTIISGRGIACMSLPRDDVEFSKTITSIAIAGVTAVLIDNVSGILGSPAFDGALTATTWTGRVLGHSKMTAALPLLVTWYATGNNVAIGADTSRRTLHIRLETPLEKPEERTDFAHRDLLGYVQSHRAELAVACCTILKAYMDAGSPDQGLREWGSFEKWSALIRGAIVWAGEADPGETRVEFAERSDIEANALKALLAAWEQLDPDGHGLTAAHALRLLDEFPDKYTLAREVFVDQFAHGKAKAASTRAIGKRLSGFRRRVIAGRMFDCQPDRNGVQEWFVTAGTAGFKGLCGVSPNPPRATPDTHVCNRYAHMGGGEQTPPNPETPQADPETCNHEPHERTTFDGFVRTECRLCGAILKPDRKATEAVA